MLIKTLLILIYHHLLLWFPMALMKLPKKFIPAKLLGRYIKNGFLV